ncbi:ANTAR domain-containing protein [Streptomyces sp. NPDC059002]|uniref:ANTAR domain-containing protein n=1 Tax=Streptomyces sp. NPDC059002 TaxID=3346690 RepID=UPI0036BE5CAF
MTANPHHPGPGPEEAASASERVGELADEVAQLKQAVWSHATVDQAIGIVLVLGRMTPEEAWDVLREVSMRTNIKLRDVSRQIVDWGGTGVLTDQLRDELDRQLALRRPSDVESTTGDYT